MKVLDASVVVDSLIDPGPRGRLARRHVIDDPHLAAPTVMRYEVASVLRRRVLAGSLEPDSGRAALDRLRNLRALELPVETFLGRMWQLRQNVSVFDAAYVAAAEATGATLVTVDAALAGAPGLRCDVELIAGGPGRRQRE